MNIGLSQSLELSQRLVLTQALIQRFNVLQQTATEFEQTLHDVAEKNPFIQVYRRDSASSQKYAPTEDNVSPLDFATYEDSLISVLTNQLDHQGLSDKEYDMVLTLIDHCNEKGFVVDYKRVREQLMKKHGVSERDVFRCLKILQSFEPDGVGARSINECLWLQIDHYDLDNPSDITHLKTLVKDYLSDISQKNYNKITEALNLSNQQLLNYIEFISHLNPNPGQAFSKGQIMHVQPSLQVECHDEVLTLVNLEEQRISVSLNESMLMEMEKKSTPDLQEKLKQAKIWMDHFQKRQQLLMNCGEYLIQKQRLYFLEGEAYILPCLQKKMAMDLNVSQSTISRLVRTKYIQSNHGVHPIQILCQRGYFGKTKNQIKSLVQYYCNRYTALSDAKISELLKGIGFPIARRTVTKYRHETNTDASYSRKKTVKTRKPILGIPSL